MNTYFVHYLSMYKVDKRSRSLNLPWHEVRISTSNSGGTPCKR